MEKTKRFTAANPLADIKTYAICMHIYTSNHSHRVFYPENIYIYIYTHIYIHVLSGHTGLYIFWIVDYMHIMHTCAQKSAHRAY